MTSQTALSLLSQVTGLASALILYWASFGVRWEDQSIRGQSQRELAFKRRQKRLGWTGAILAVIAFGCQTILTLQP